MAKVTLASGLIVALGYVFEFFTAWYSGEEVERAHVRHLFTGAYWPATAIMLTCNVAVPQLLWLRSFRRGPLRLFVLCILVNVGMWTERYVIVVTPLAKDFVPSAWSGGYHGTLWDWLLLIGTLGFFLALVLLFLKLVPMLSMSELREQHHEEWPSESDAAPVPSAERSAPLPDEELFALAGWFRGPERLVEGARRLRAAGFRAVEAYAPYSVPGLAEALGHRTRIAGVVLAGALVGIGGAWLLMYGSAVIDYPWNIGGRPLNSLPSFVPVLFEMAVLGGALAGTLAFLVRCGLPRPYHAVMNAAGFEGVALDRFLLCVEQGDPAFERERVRKALVEAGAAHVEEVPR